MPQVPLRILVIGAGVIGSVYAARLQAAGHTVTLQARGQHAADLRATGLSLEDATKGQSTTSHIRIVDRLDPDDVYDLALVCVRLGIRWPLLYRISRPISRFPRWCFC